MMPARIFSDTEEENFTNDFDILLFLGYTWREIANFKGVSEKTIWNIRLRIGYIPRLALIIVNDDLDEMVRRFICNHQETGKFFWLVCCHVSYFLFRCNYAERNVQVPWI